MDTFEDLISVVQSDMNIDNNSSLYPLATVKKAINRSYRRCGGLYLWPKTEDAKTTSTQLNIEYYDYPENWRPNSIWKLVVDDKDYGDPIAFKDYLYEKENSLPSGLTKMWANQWTRYFIYPTPTAPGTDNISVWGQKVVDELTENGDTTIFSYNLPECNDAVVEEAKAILKNKGEDTNADQFLSLKAKQILTIAWIKIARSLAKQEKTQPMFDVTDLFGPKDNEIKNDIGRF